jgi:natural product precursor
MKKQVKKLKLAKETLHKLEDEQLTEAAGGTTWWNSCIWNCIRPTLEDQLSRDC